MFFFRKIWRALFSCNTHFEIHPFALLLAMCSFLSGFFRKLVKSNWYYSHKLFWQVILVKHFICSWNKASLFSHWFLLKWNVFSVFLLAKITLAHSLLRWIGHSFELIEYTFLGYLDFNDSPLNGAAI